MIGRFARYAKRGVYIYTGEYTLMYTHSLINNI